MNTLKALCLSCVLFTVSTDASAYAFSDLFEMTVEELLNVNVTVASLSPERIIETPAVVSRYDVEDMSGLGLRTLKDILSFFPGFVLQDTDSGATTIMIRGLVEGWNQKVLFLLDDIPYWMPSHSDIPLLGMPIESISHIEVIRGPGAVMYGSNATAGVIRVVTKKAHDLQADGSTLSFSAGSNRRANGGGHIQHNLSDTTSVSLAFEIQSEEGYEGEYRNVSQPAFFPDGINDDGSAIKSQEMKSVLAKYHHGNFNLVGHAFESRSNKADEPSILSINNDLIYTGYLFHADNSWHLRNTELTLYSDYNRFYLEGELNSGLGVGISGGARFADHGDDNYRWRSGISLLHQLSDTVEFFGGFEFERRKIEDYLFYNPATDAVISTLIPSQHTLERSLYGQVDYRSEKWRFLLGGRYINSSQSGEKLTPRLSSVYTLDQHQSIKLLYSVGFNAPNFTQTHISAPNILVGNPDLSAETVSTLDLAYSFEEGNRLFVFNLFYLKAEDFIRRRLQEGVTHFFNSKSFERYGFEFDFQKATSDYRFFSNFSYTHQGDQPQENDMGAALF